MDFLEGHPDYSLTVHEYKEWNESEQRFRPHQIEFLKNTKEDLTLTLDDYATGVFFTKTLTAVYRLSAMRESNYKYYGCYFDMTRFYALMTQGKCRLFNRVMGVYRIQPNSLTASKNISDFRRATNAAMLGVCKVEQTEQSREFVYNYLKPLAFSVIRYRQWKTIKNYFKYLGLRRALILSFVEPVKIVFGFLSFKKTV